MSYFFLSFFLSNSSSLSSQIPFCFVFSSNKVDMVSTGGGLSLSFFLSLFLSFSLSLSFFLSLFLARSLISLPLSVSLSFSVYSWNHSGCLMIEEAESNTCCCRRCLNGYGQNYQSALGEREKKKREKEKRRERVRED